jgi:hypothetical protein
MADAKSTLLCSIKFWAGTVVGATPGGYTLRKGARLPARRQGFSPSELDKAERQLIKEGLVLRDGNAVALTKRGIAKAAKGCKNVSLAPWDINYALHPKRG